MNSNNFFEELEKYFENTSKEKIDEDWQKSLEYDQVGPTMEEFLSENESTIRKNPNQCQKCSCPEEQLHPCPYASEIHGDEESLCNCCSECVGVCLDEI